MTVGPRIEQITDLNHPELEPYRTLRRPKDHVRQGIFVAEGEKVVHRMLASPIEVVSMLVAEEWLKRLDTKTLQRVPRIYSGEKRILETIVGFHLHQGIMAVGRVPAPRLLEDVLAHPGRPVLLVALDGLVNSENVGIVVRNCAAFGVDALLVGETSSSPYLRRAVRNSMGAVFDLPIIHATDLAESLTIVRSRYSTRVLAADPHAHVAIDGMDFGGNVCIVLGNEGEGVSDRVLAVCSERVSIPMQRGVDSLNVGSASAVLLYEATRKRIVTGANPP